MLSVKSLASQWFVRASSGTRRTLRWASRGFGDPTQHSQRVSLIIGILEPSDHRLRRIDPIGQLLLRQAPTGSELVDVASYLRVDTLLFNHGTELRATPHGARRLRPSTNVPDSRLRPIIRSKG